MVPVRPLRSDTGGHAARAHEWLRMGMSSCRFILFVTKPLP
jgi:hypothetical protein